MPHGILATGAADDVFTTSQVAAICKVAPRTVAKWIDGGVLKGYRLPMSRDRRVRRDVLMAFLRENEMPMGRLAEAVEPSPPTAAG